MSIWAILLFLTTWTILFSKPDYYSPGKGNSCEMFIISACIQLKEVRMRCKYMLLAYAELRCRFDFCTACARLIKATENDVHQTRDMARIFTTTLLDRSPSKKSKSIWMQCIRRKLKVEPPRTLKIDRPDKATENRWTNARTSGPRRTATTKTTSILWDLEKVTLAAMWRADRYR